MPCCLGRFDLDKRLDRSYDGLELKTKGTENTMAIKQNKDLRYTKKMTSFSGASYSEEVFPWIVDCDGCGKQAHGHGDDPGLASDNARRDHFTTVPSKSLALPSKWYCKSCRELIDAKKGDA